MRKAIPLLLLLLLSVSINAYDKKCVERYVRRYNFCHLDALHKSDRGNTRPLRSRICENELISKMGECFGERTISDCERRAGNVFINCQSRQNDKFRQGNLRARGATRCLTKLERLMIDCEKQEQGIATTEPETADSPVAITTSQKFTTD